MREGITETYKQKRLNIEMLLIFAVLGAI